MSYYSGFVRTPGMWEGPFSTQSPLYPGECREVGGRYYAVGRDGRTKPIEDCVEIKCGRDFEQCARHNTEFEYRHDCAVSKKHKKFWHGRKFKVLMVKAAKKEDENWIYGETVAWEEYTTGAMQMSMEWKLKAKISPSRNYIGLGSLVSDDHGVALITGLDDESGKMTVKGSNGKTKEMNIDDSNRPTKRAKIDDVSMPLEVTSGVKVKEEQYAADTDEEDDRKPSAVTSGVVVKTEDDAYGYETDDEPGKMHPFYGVLEFDVHRMNVQGGGILKCTNLTEDPLSFLWLDKVTEKVGEEDKFNKGGWYFDPPSLDLESMVKDQKVIDLRNENMKLLKEATTAAKEGDFLGRLQEMALSLWKENSTEFQKLIMSIPLSTYENIVLHILNAYERGLRYDEQCVMVHSMATIGTYLLKDSEWLTATKLDDDASEEKHDFNIAFNAIGEWFEDELEYRAALDCYKLILENNDSSDIDPNSLVIALCNAGLACKRMDNYVDALKFYEEAIILGKSEDVDFGYVINNVEILHEEAQEWLGTSGCVASWGTFEGNVKCASCEGPLIECSSCHVIHYCNSNCHKNHWHLHNSITCWGVKRENDAEKDSQ